MKTDEPANLAGSGPAREWVLEALHRYESPLLRYALRLTGDLDRARDIVQDTFLTLCEADRASVNGHLAAWLYTVCRNRAADIGRKERRMNPLNETELALCPSGDASYSPHAFQEQLTAESYEPITDNAFTATVKDPMSTFSIDVDTAAYSNVRRYLNGGAFPPKDAVRIEELINYFDYDYAPPTNEHPFASHIETAACPWKPEHRLVRIALKGRIIEETQRPPCNLVFLLDVSGSMSSDNKLPLVKQSIIEEKAKTGVFLSILGFGMGNLKDSTLEMLADKGNGNYGYIDTLNEAVKVFSDQLSGTLVTIAKDVKIQIRFNPSKVGAFRLIGYENRILAHEDFNDDTKDAGEIGAGHAVTALYEIVPAGMEMPYIVHEVKPTDSLFNLALKYKASVTEIRGLNNMQTDVLTPGSKLLIPAVNPQEAGAPVSATETIALEDGATPVSVDSLLTLSLRYKKPDEDTSHLMVSIVCDEGKAFEQSSADFKFAAAAAEFGMVLRDSPYRGTSNFDEVLKLAQENTGADKNGYRAEFVELINKAKALGAGK